MSFIDRILRWHGFKIALTNDGTTPLGSEESPIHITGEASSATFDAVKNALAVADDAVDLNGQDLTVGAIEALSGFRYMPFWILPDVSAELDNEPMNFGGSAETVLAWPAPAAGSVRRLIVKLTSAAAGAALDVQLFKAGSAFAGVTATVAIAAVEALVEFDLGEHTFVALADLDPRISTAAGWTATTADVSVFVEVSC